MLLLNLVHARSSRCLHLEADDADILFGTCLVVIHYQVNNLAFEDVTLARSSELDVGLDLSVSPGEIVFALCIPCSDLESATLRDLCRSVSLLNS